MAANLRRASHAVTPVAGNERVVAALRQHGYRVIDFDGSTWSEPVQAEPVLTLQDSGYDLAIVATQSTALEKALTSALPHLKHDAPIVVCQNGLPEERARKVLTAAGADPRRVVGCVVGWGASMVEPGVFKRTSRGGLQLGASDSVDAASIARMLECTSPGSPVVVASDLAGVRWSKLAINCVTTTLGALGGAALGPLLAHRHVRRLALEVFAEVVAVAQAEGVRIQPVSGTLAIDDIAITPRERGYRVGSPSLAYKHAVLLAVGFKYRKMRSSMLYALERGRPLEIEHLNGEVVRRGAEHGVPTPVNSMLVSEVHALARTEKRPARHNLRRVWESAIANGAHGSAGAT